MSSPPSPPAQPAPPAPPSLGAILEYVYRFAHDLRMDNPKADGKTAWEVVSSLLPPDWIAKHGWASEVEVAELFRHRPRLFAELRTLQTEEFTADGALDEMAHFLAQTARLPWGGIKKGKPYPARPANLKTLVQVVFNAGQYDGSVAAGVAPVEGFPTAPLCQIGHFLKAPQLEEAPEFPPAAVEKLRELSSR